MRREAKARTRREGVNSKKIKRFVSSRGRTGALYLLLHLCTWSMIFPRMTCANVKRLAVRGIDLFFSFKTPPYFWRRSGYCIIARPADGLAAFHHAWCG